MQILLRKIEELKQHAARRSARNNYPRGVEHHSAVEIKEKRENKEPLSRRSFQRIRRNITKTDSVWSRIDTARSSSLKEMRGEERSWNDRQGEATQILPSCPNFGTRGALFTPSRLCYQHATVISCWGERTDMICLATCNKFHIPNGHPTKAH
jgi:hypothetical protein